MRSDELPAFDPRPSIRVVNTMPEHPKIAGLSDAAFRTLIELWCMCSRQDTDGTLLRPMVNRAANPKVLAELKAAGVVRDLGDKYEMHDYLKHNRSRAEVASIRASKKESGSKGAHMRWHVPSRRKVKDCELCFPEAVPF